MTHIILFDGVCNFCNASVQFILNRDSKGLYHFASLQGDAGSSLLQKHGIKEDMTSLVLIEGDRYYTKSSAVLRICRHLKGAYPLLTIFSIVPVPIRNLLYDVIAKYRYKWFGKQDSCMIPAPDVRERFLD